MQGPREAETCFLLVHLAFYILKIFYLNKICAHAIIEMFLATCRFGSSLSISATFFREKDKIKPLSVEYLRKKYCSRHYFSAEFVERVQHGQEWENVGEEGGQQNLRIKKQSFMLASTRLDGNDSLVRLGIAQG